METFVGPDACVLIDARVVTCDPVTGFEEGGPLRLGAIGHSTGPLTAAGVALTGTLRPNLYNPQYTSILTYFVSEVRWCAMRSPPSFPLRAPLCGAPVPADRVIGREAIIAEIWEKLAHQSVLLTAERRIGKSAILNKLASEPRPGWKVVHRVVEGTSAPAELINDLRRDIEHAMGQGDAALSRLRRLYDASGISGMTLGPITLPLTQQSWKAALMSLLEDAGSVEGQRCVVVWDEFPNMVWKIAQSDPAMAADLVDTLRAYRQAKPDGVKFVLAGSIGFHLVLRFLVDKGAHRSRPANDLATIHAGALAQRDAVILAREGLEYYIANERISLEEPLDAIAAAVAEAADRLPFYVEHIVADLGSLGRPITTAEVHAARERLIGDDTLGRDLRHYRARIRDYYPDRERDAATEVLNTLCRHPGGLTKDDLRARLSSLQDRELDTALDLLLDDHYLVRDSAGERRFRFKYVIVRDYWEAA